jgi:tetratricopeptide (TPR) repeat protein
MAAALLIAQEPFAQPAEAALPAPLAVSAPASEPPAPDRESDLYNQATKDLDANQWENALTGFDQVVQMRGPHADGALYWKAYALNKLGRREDALAALSTLQKSYAQSHWNNDAKALEVEIRQSMGEAVSPDNVSTGSPDNVSNEDLKLIAINGLMNSDPDRAVPLLEKVLQSNQPPKVKERALFVLSQSGSPKARAIISSIARGQGDRTLQRKALEDLALFGGKESKAELASIYASSDDVEVKKSILRGFMISGEKDRVLAAAKTEKNPELRREAVRQLGVMGAGDELWQLYQTESSPDTKREIIRALFVGGQVDRVYNLAQNEKDDQMRREAIRSLGLLGSGTADKLTSLYQNEKSVDIRKEIMNAFFIQGNAKALVNLARNEKDPKLRKTAVEKLSVMNSKESTDFMMEILNK